MYYKANRIIFGPLIPLDSHVSILKITVYITLCIYLCVSLEKLFDIFEN